MIEKNITIELFRVDKTSKNLDVMFTCPEEYYFDEFNLNVEVLNDDNTFTTQFFSLASALFDNNDSHDTCTKDKKHWVVRIPLDKLGINSPAIYEALLEAEFDTDAEVDDPDEYPPPITRKAVCSDVNGVYRCLLQDVLKDASCDACSKVSDDVIRNYLILYGHHAALCEGQIDEAKEYYKLLSRCFAKCSGDSSCDRGHCCGSTPQKSSPCNCH